MKRFHNRHRTPSRHQSVRAQNTQQSDSKLTVDAQSKAAADARASQTGTA